VPATPLFTAATPERVTDISCQTAADDDDHERAADPPRRRAHDELAA
jgi:hypothetical protein